MGMSPLNDLRDFILGLDVGGGFDVWGACYGFQNQLSHQPGAIRDHYTDGLGRHIYSLFQSVPLQCITIGESARKEQVQKGLSMAYGVTSFRRTRSSTTLVCGHLSASTPFYNAFPVPKPAHPSIHP